MIVERLLRVALLGSSWVLYLLLALSMVSLAAMLDRWLYFRQHGGRFETVRRAVSDALLAGDLDAARAALASSRLVEAGIVVQALRWSDGGADAVADAVESESARAREDLERRVNLLGTLGNNAPFVGLFGTVIGVIEAFSHLGTHAAQSGSMGNVMTGIAEALVATAVGIFVALPAVVAYNAAQAKIGQTETNVQVLARLFGAYLKTVEHRQRASHDAPPAREASAVRLVTAGAP